MNYVISANNRFHHLPSHLTIAGIFAAQLIRQYNVCQGQPAQIGQVQRIFFTDGSSVYLEEVQPLVEQLVSNVGGLAAERPEDWRKWVQMWAFYTDVAVVIPTDGGAVEGCIELKFPRDDTRTQQLNYLYKVLQDPAPAQIPRARASWNRRFSLRIGPAGDTYLDLDTQGRLISINHVAGQPPEFILHVMDKPLSVTPKLKIFKYEVEKVQGDAMTLPTAVGLRGHQTRAGAGPSPWCHVYNEHGQVLVNSNLDQPVTFANHWTTTVATEVWFLPRDD